VQLPVKERGKMKIILMLILAILLTLFGGLYWWYREVSFREKFEKSQIACLTSILLNDTRGEDPENRGFAQELVADTVVRFRRANPTLGFCDIHKSGMTIYPKNWERAPSFTGRSSTLTGLNPFNWGTARTEAENRARIVIERGLIADRCATHYIRAKPGYDSFTNELAAQKSIESTMKPDKPVPSLKMRFFCQ
jgi:hypothetical protein